MEFTKDIKFGRKPMNSKYLKLTYSGSLFKKNSSDVSIVYGFGENWEKTNEQKMQKLPVGFRAHVQMENYDTFNFCFKNSNNEWDNNNGFNYITPIEKLKTNSNANSSTNEFKDNYSEKTETINNSQDVSSEDYSTNAISESNSNSDILDALVQELFEEYNNKFSSNTTVDSTECPNEPVEANIQKENENNIELFQKMDSLLDNIIEEIENNESNLSESSSYSPIDIGKELDNLFVKTFSESNIQAIQPYTEESYIPQACEDNIFKETSANPVNTSLEKKIENTTSTVENDIFDFNNLDFDFEMNSNKSEIESNYIDFSDSFYDDEDLSIHHAFTNIQEVVNSTVESLNNETSFDEAQTEEFEKNLLEYDKIVSEYTEYFDSLIEEIVSAPTSYLSTPVSNEQVFENEKTDLSVTETSSLPVESAQSTDADISASVQNEYALFDYKSQGFFYTLMRRCKLLLSTVFSKIPKLFGKQTEDDNQ